MRAEFAGKGNGRLNDDRFAHSRPGAQHGCIALIATFLHFLGEQLDDIEILRMDGYHLPCLSHFTEHFINLAQIQRRNCVFHAFLVIVDKLIGFGIDGVSPEELEAHNARFL
ncbi:hypothetical protein SDC9_210315 [bioreactor metagenome]|uniref:Uncharacterized protein n=1 Tax=bioreactor metagenome TaxID=1076179 RepID=A0A645JGI7_9ZZZZ